jgi:glycosyltransferase involved in cell wall biosynthesis
LAPLLRGRGIDVSIVTRRYSGLPAFELVDGVPVYRVPIPGPRAVASLSYTMSTVSRLLRLRPDIIHAHEFFSPATTAIAAKALLRVPVVVTAHRSGQLGDVAVLQRRVLGKQRLATLVRSVDAFVTISNEIDAELAATGIPPDRRFTVPNGVDTARFHPAPAGAKTRLRAEAGLPDVPIVVFVGRLAPEKRVEHLVGIWPQVRSAHPDAILLILGSGPDGATLRNAAGPGVRFGGEIDDVSAYLRAADVFVLPSVAEGLSVAMLEAMASGIAVVATAVGGASDVIEHSRNGWLVPADDVAALRDAITTLLGDRECAEALGARARDTIVRDYSLPAIAERTHAMYQRLVARDARQPARHDRVAFR